MQNDVAQGLSSAIFTTDLREANAFLQRSDCGIREVQSFSTEALRMVTTA